MKKYITILALALVAVAVPFQTGCTTTGGLSDQGQAIAKAAVEIAVSEVVANNPSSATQIIDIAEQIKKVAGTEGFNTVDLLVSAIKIRANLAALDPQKQILANLLIDTIAAQLKAKFPNGQINSVNSVFIAQLADWVEEGARLVTVTPAK